MMREARSRYSSIFTRGGGRGFGAGGTSRCEVGGGIVGVCCAGVWMMKMTATRISEKVRRKA